MSKDEARELFSAAFDEQLTPEQRKAFDSLLAGDAELKTEYEQFKSMLGDAHRLSLDDDLGAPPPDLLGKVQTKLRKRSRGRYYRDRYSEKTGLGAMLPIIIGLVMLIILATVYVTMQYVQPLEERAGTQQRR